MLILQNIAYSHPNKDLLFDNINLIVNTYSKTALVGNNGSGKSTLLQLIAGMLHPARGTIQAGAKPHYIPQHFGQFNRLSVAQALGADTKIKALRNILDGQVTEENLALLEDDWTIEDRCRAALDRWQLNHVDPEQNMGTLSGGEKTKVFLAGISMQQPGLILMDEPSNHLDLQGRQLLYDFIQETTSTLVVVSHDIKLLNLLDQVCELDKRGITVYGGNYDFYTRQKTMELNALNEDVRDREKTLRKAKEAERDTMERQQKLDARGKKKQEKAGLPTIAMKTFRNNAEKSTARIQEVHAGKLAHIAKELDELRKELPDMDRMKFGFDSRHHKGKILFTAAGLNFEYGNKPLWQQAIDMLVTTGERLAIKGPNGSGKTTLVKLILGEIESVSGSVQRAAGQTVYIDQDYSLINNRLNVYEQAQAFNHEALQEHEIKTRLSRFLFGKEHWSRSCSVLSGGERMRLMLCCLTIAHQAPDMIILDEPTNNLDILNTKILTSAINDYQGTLIVISHDEDFLARINVSRVIDLYP